MATRNRDLARLVRRRLDAGHHEQKTNLITGAGMHAAYHRTCGHAVLVGPDRQTIASVINNLRGSGRFALRIRIATRDDIESATRGITCNLCRSLV